MTRRQLIKGLTLAATAAVSGVSAASAAPAQATGYVAKALAFNHVSYQVSDYKKCRDFYAGLFGMKVSMDDGMQCRLSFGENILIVRNRTPAPKVDHIAYTLAGWDRDESVKPAVEAELKHAVSRYDRPKIPRVGSRRLGSAKGTGRKGPVGRSWNYFFGRLICLTQLVTGGSMRMRVPAEVGALSHAGL